MASQKIDVEVIESYRWFENLGQPVRYTYIHHVKLKRFAVYYPTDADWKERAELIHDQIVSKVGTQVTILEGWFLYLPNKTFYQHSEEEISFLSKLQKLLRWEKGKTPVEDRWLKMHRPATPLRVTSRTHVVEW